MRRLLPAALLLGLCLVPAGVAARRQDAGARASELAAQFNKEKHKVKEVRGVRLERYKEVRSEPAARANAADYSGSYVADPDYTLDLRVSAGGAVEGRGTEPAQGGARRFTLREARVSGALLTGTKVYEDGSTENLEAVFINRTERRSQTDAGSTTFGLGLVFDPAKTAPEGFEVTRLFYELKR